LVVPAIFRLMRFFEKSEDVFCRREIIKIVQSAREERLYLFVRTKMRPFIPNNNNNNNQMPPTDLHAEDASNNTAAGLVSETTVTLGDVDFCLHEWSCPASSRSSSSSSMEDVVVIIFHGFLAHGLYPTVRYAAEFLSQKGNVCKVVAPDLRGHGESSGLPGFLPSADIVLQDGVAIVEHVAQTMYPHQKIVLLGSSMGGTIALQVAMSLRKKAATTTRTNSPAPSPMDIAGVILLAPMLKLGVDVVSRHVLYGLAQFVPTWCIIPSSSTSAEKQYRDAIKRQECESDPYTVQSSSNSGKIRVASASTCVELAGRMQQNDFCQSVDIPFFIGVADEDMVVDNQGSLDLFRESVSRNKTLKMYPALHGLLCEPSPLFDEIQDDILEWLRKLC
jgi:acylglycerol lipase